MAGAVSSLCNVCLVKNTLAKYLWYLRNVGCFSNPQFCIFLRLSTDVYYVSKCDLQHTLPLSVGITETLFMFFFIKYLLIVSTYRIYFSGSQELKAVFFSSFIMFRFQAHTCIFEYIIIFILYNITLPFLVRNNLLLLCCFSRNYRCLPSL